MVEALRENINVILKQQRSGFDLFNKGRLFVYDIKDNKEYITNEWNNNSVIVDVYSNTEFYKNNTSTIGLYYYPKVKKIIIVYSAIGRKVKKLEYPLKESLIKAKVELGYVYIKTRNIDYTFEM